MDRETLRIRMTRRAPLWQPRGMAVICFAAVALGVFTTIFPVREEIDLLRRGVAAAVTLGAGVAYWTLAPLFRTWMVHAIVVIGFLSGLGGLARADNELAAALVLTTLLWTGVFVGAAFPPRTSRVYEVLICLGIAGAMSVNRVSGDAAVGVAFAASFIVIMEILSRATSQLRREATTDPLTGLLNRTGLEREVNRVRSFGRDDRIAVLVADLDGFKKVNDRQGHRAGDRLLTEFGSAWRNGARAGDLIARVGGDEFVAVFADVEEDAARRTVERLREVSPAEWSGGLVIAEPGESLDSCIGRADLLLYEEKAAKRRAVGGAPAGHPPQPVSSR